MSYIKKTMQKDEEIRLPVKLHWINYVGAFSILIVAFLLLIYYMIPDDYDKSDLIVIVVVVAGTAFYQFLKLWFIEMAVTNKRVVLRKGIIAIDSDEIKNSKIEGIEVEQSVFGRILNYGDVCFAGVGVGKLKFSNISQPWEVKRMSDEIIGE